MNKLHRNPDSQHSSTTKTGQSHRPTAHGSNQQRLQSVGPTTAQEEVCHSDWGMSLQMEAEQGMTEEEAHVAAMEAQMRDCTDAGYDFNDRTGECSAPKAAAPKSPEECREADPPPVSLANRMNQPTISTDRSPRERRDGSGSGWLDVIGDGLVGCLKGGSTSVVRNATSVIPAAGARNAIVGCAYGAAREVSTGLRERRKGK